MAFLIVATIYSTKFGKEESIQQQFNQIEVALKNILVNWCLVTANFSFFSEKKAVITYSSTPIVSTYKQTVPSISILHGKPVLNHNISSVFLVCDHCIFNLEEVK